MNENKKRGIPEMGVDAMVLYRQIAALKKGDIISYEDLNASIRGNVQGKQRGILMSARRKALTQDDVVTCCVPKVGIKRMEDGDISEIHAGILDHIRRASRNGIRKQQCVDYTALSNEAKRAYNTGQSMLGMIAHIAKGSSMRLVEDRVQSKLAIISFKETLSLFGNGLSEKGN